MLSFKPRFVLLIVCKANITRSAYLAGYMRYYIKKHLPHLQRKICLRSAGVKARQGGSASQVVKHVAKQNGFSLLSHHSSPLSKRSIRKADAILVMEHSQKEAIQKFSADAKGKTFLLTEYLQSDNDAKACEVPDPTGLDLSEYRSFIDLAHNETDRIFREISRSNLV